MPNESFVSEEEKLDMFRVALGKNHFQEMNDHSAEQILFSQNLHKRHLQEIAQISILVNPVGWARVIGRYTRQLSKVTSINKITRSLMIARHEQEIIKLENLIDRQKLFLKLAQRTDILFLDRFTILFDWSFSENQKRFYHQALTSGYALVLTDITQSILWVSQAFETMTGYNSIEVTNKNARFLQGEATDQAAIQHMRQYLYLGREVEVKLVNYRKRGDAYLCHVRITPLCNREGKPTHFIAVENEIDTCPQP